MMELRSILKKGTGNGRNAYVNAVEPVEDRNRATALHHANLIQAQKDVEREILTSIEAFLDCPTSTPASPSDIQSFKSLVSSFQPTDYDELLVERQAADKCAYVLCPNPSPASDKTSIRGKYRLVFNKALKGEDAFQIVDAGQASKWCSVECARRALYVRVQLSEEPAWMREGETGPGIVLLEEKDGDVAHPSMQASPEAVDHHDNRQQLQRVMALPMRPKKNMPTLEKLGEAGDNMRSLALERGDKESSSRPARVVQNDVVERDTSESVTAPHLVDQYGRNSHSSIEGYETDSGRE